ncbi:hypothetical protein BH11PSE1_BH11PSE1_10510 [soil metagenome]
MIGFDEVACRMCGCTDSRACEGGCYWVEADLCSACEAMITFERKWLDRLVLAGKLAVLGLLLCLALMGVANAVRGVGEYFQ